ncbi:MAG: pirin [Rhodospirillales bacterium]|nr:pirin [Rhodospirillales bacterium]
MSVRFILRAGDRGYSYLPSTGLNASYVAGHPDGVITRHSSFNFHEYQSGIPGLGVMKVFGDETFTPGGTGYNMHPHHNFIIMAFVLGGTLTHINTIAKVDELREDDYYVFAAGSGGKHSELNIGEQDLHVIYVWMLPGQLLAPLSYRRNRFDRAAGANRITCLVGDEQGALPIGQTVKVSRLLSDADRTHVYRAAKANGIYTFVVEGDVEIAEAILTRRDSLALEGEDKIEIKVRTAGTDILVVETKL